MLDFKANDNTQRMTPQGRHKRKGDSLDPMGRIRCFADADSLSKTEAKIHL
jgi:hypothetical protein